MRIEVFRSGGLGDIFLITPLLLSLKERYKKSTLVLTSNYPEGSELVSYLIALGLIDECIEYSKSNILSAIKKRIRMGRMDLTFNLDHQNKNEIKRLFEVFYFLLIRRPYSWSGFYAKTPYTLNNFNSNKGEKVLHEIDRGYSIIESLGITLNRTYFINKIVSQKYRNSKNKYVIINPYSKPFLGLINKSWNIENFICLGSFFANDGFMVQVVGNSNAIVPFLENHYNVVDKRNSTSLQELTELIAGADYYIGNDSGPLHIASALNIPYLGVFADNNYSGKFSSKSKKGLELRYENFELLTTNEVYEIYKQLIGFRIT